MTCSFRFRGNSRIKSLGDSAPVHNVTHKVLKLILIEYSAFTLGKQTNKTPQLSMDAYAATIFIYNSVIFAMSTSRLSQSFALLQIDKHTAPPLSNRFVTLNSTLRGI